MAADKLLAQRIVDYLNELTETDRCAIAALIANRVPCNETLADHPTCQVAAQHGGYLVGLLGLLNGLCGSYNDGPKKGFGFIAAEFKDGSPGGWRDLSHFAVVENE